MLLGQIYNLFLLYQALTKANVSIETLTEGSF